MRLYVHPLDQGRGFGRALLAAAVESVARRGVRDLIVAVDARNRRARNWYLGQGFVPAGRSVFELGAWSLPQRVLVLAVSPR